MSLFRTASILILVILVSLLVTFGSYPAFLLSNQGHILKESMWFQLISSISSFLVMFLTPLLIIKFVIKKKIEDFGLKLPIKQKEAILYSSLILLFSLPIMLYFGNQFNFQSYYQGSGQKLLNSFFIFTLTSFIYYLSEEFVFRGFLLFNLFEDLGDFSIYVSGILFSLFHIGKPINEVFFALVLGIALGYLALKTKSILPGTIVHLALALILNTLVLF